MHRALVPCIVAFASVVRAQSIPLAYESNLVERGFPSPVVRVSLPGRAPAQFLLDTGASVHTLASWFVKAVDIATEQAEGSARGSTGQQTGIRVARNADVVLGNGRRLHLGDAIAVEFPPMFEELRIAGLLSPQLLASPGKVAVLDLRKPSLSFESSVSAVDSLGYASRTDAHVCVDRESDFRNRAYSVPITVAGHQASVVLDSGATSTVIAAESDAGKALASSTIEGKHTQGLGGAAEANRHAPAVEIERGGTSTVVDVNLGRSPGAGCGPDGLLGMDALRDCSLLLGDSTAAIACSPGARPSLRVPR